VSAQPCLGYPSRSAAVIGLRAEGLPDREIARRIGIEPKTVSALAISAERKIARQDAVGWSPSRSSLILPLDVQQRLRKAAAARQVSVYQLALTIVEIVATNGLADAVLDDGVRSA
jgi:DNA-binding NarL/FixJ family response regulator